MSGTHSLFAGQIWRSLLLSDNVPAQCGAAIQITASVAGEIVLTLWGGNTHIVTVGVGDSIYGYECTMFHATTATVTRCYNLFQ